MIQFKPSSPDYKLRMIGHRCCDNRWDYYGPLKKREPNRYHPDAKINIITLCDIAAKLHYLGSHSPDPIRKKWYRVEDTFVKRHTGGNRYWRWTYKFTIDRYI